MSDPSDNRPVAPPRSLAQPVDQSGARNAPGSGSAMDGRAQPAMSGQYSSGASSAYSASDTPTERSMPVPPLANPSARSGSTSPQQPQPDHTKADRAAKRAQAHQPRTVRRAKLRIVRVDPWSVTKASLLLSIAFGIMCVVAVFLIFSIMTASGLWDSVNNTIQGVLKQKPADQFDIKEYVGMSRIMGITMLISAIDVIIITALATLGAFIYNMAASLLGGVEVTLAEDLR
jgi:Transmembrane domain of unknown function (DUF3566)